MSNIHRYDKVEVVHSNLDPLNDVVSWIGGLRSKGLAKTILKENHGIRDSRNLNNRAAAINEHIDTAVGLLEQGFRGPIETSFLPLYYAMMNLSKIYIICSNQFLFLRYNRRHGAYSRPRTRGQWDFLKDKIILETKGTIPLLYKTLTNSTLAKENSLTLGEIFPFIVNVSHEYQFLYRSKPVLQHCDLIFSGDDSNGYKIQLDFKNPVVNRANHKNSNQFLKDFNKKKNNKYQTELIYGNSADAKKEIKRKIKRFLIYQASNPFQNSMETFLPISGKRVLLPEELPILLVFFHLSNIVRYNPELLHKIKNSPEWGMLQALSRHGTYKFMLLFWSYVHQTSFAINTY